MIQLRDVEKFYEAKAGKTFVLRRINADIQEGEFVTIMGPSGAGKSTLLAILGMLDGVFEGEFHFFGNPVHRLKPRQRIELNKKYIGFVFQCAGSARTGERTLRVSVDAALRAGIFKASGSFDPMGWSVGARRSFPRP